MSPKHTKKALPRKGEKTLTDWPVSLTFSMKKYKNGHWSAQCRQVSGIITGGPRHSDIEGVWNEINASIISAMGLKIRLLPPKTQGKKIITKK